MERARVCRAFSYTWVQSGLLSVSDLKKLTALLEVMEAEKDRRMIERLGAVQDQKLYKKVLDRSKKVIDWIKVPVSKKDWKMPSDAEWNRYKAHFGIWKNYALSTQDQAIKAIEGRS